MSISWRSFASTTRLPPSGSIDPDLTRTGRTRPLCAGGRWGQPPPDTGIDLDGTGRFGRRVLSPELRHHGARASVGSQKNNRMRGHVVSKGSQQHAGSREARSR